METAGDNPKEFEELLHKLCDSSLDVSERARFARLLASSKSAKRRYIEHIEYCNTVACATADRGAGGESRSRRPTAAIVPLNDSLGPVLPSPDSPTVWFSSSPETNRSGPALTVVGRCHAALRKRVEALSRLSPQGKFASLAGLFSLAALLLVQSLVRTNREVRPTAPPVAAMEDADNAAADFVARIVGMTHNTTWQDPHVKVDSMFRLSADETIRIATGLVKIEFYSGATVILQSPAVFTPTGPGSGRLDRGRLTGRAANGNFRLTTAAADVIDLGTEFGVTVDDVSVTDVVVFDGEVEVISLAASATAGGVLRMTEGMAARFTPAGITEHDFPARPEDFSRSLSPARDAAVDGELSLVDVICGGSGFDNYVAGAIDPRTGKTDSGVWLRSRHAGRRRGEGLFCPTRHRPPLDGVFIPPVDGRTAPIDSLGHMVVLPVYTSQTFGPIWARRQTNALGSAEGVIDYWGPDTFADVNLRLQSARHGVVGMHANVGFTIDLQAVRMRQHRQVNGFETLIAVPTPYKANHNPEKLDAAQTAVDFHVYVDGVLRDKRRSIKRADGDIRFAVPLTPSDQRLTLVVTDSEHSIIFDNFVLIDPVLTLDKTAQGRAAE